MYDVPSRVEIGKVIVTRECIQDGSAPTFIKRTGDIPKKIVRSQKGPEEKSA
jgi:ATP-dependent Clp protease ATP-binding subunit ClpX